MAKIAAIKVERPVARGPVISAVERAAYQASHEILATDFSMRKLAAPGGRRSHTVDLMAGIIQKHVEAIR